MNDFLASHQKPLTGTCQALAPAEQANLELVTMKLLQGLLLSHFAKRGRGRPRKNTEVPRLINGVKAMVKASGAAIDADEETILLRHFLNKSLF